MNKKKIYKLVTGTVDAAVRRATRRARRLPQILIVGVMKGGTTSLYNYLCQHPKIRTGREKEVHFFDTDRFNRGFAWYRSNFALSGISIDATPSYMLYETVADRIKAAIPDPWIIVVLREPAARAWSHFNHQVSRGRETRSFERAVEDDIDAYHREGFPTLGDTRARRSAFVRRSLYAEQLPWYLDRFPGRVIILRSEDLYRDPQSSVDSICDDIGLERFELNQARRYNPTRYRAEKPDLTSLRSWLRPFNDRLEALTGIRWP